MKPAGFLLFKEALRSGDKLILYPVYIFPIEVLDRGLLVRASYYRQTVIVNAFNRKTRLLDVCEPIVLNDFDASPYETHYLEVRVSLRLAANLAEYGAVPDDFRSWRRVVNNRKILVNADMAQLAWHVYAVRGGQASDIFTGEVTAAASLIDTLFC